MEPRRRRAFAWVALAYVVALGVALATGAWLLERWPGLHPVWVALGADVAATLAIFGFSVAFRNSSFYDAYWSVAPPVIVAWLALVPEAGDGDRARLLLVWSAVALWGARLTSNWARGWSGLAHEDWRYVDLAQKSGRAYWLVSFFGIHLFPTVQVFLGCLPLWYALTSPAPPGWLDAVAAVVAFGGIACEGAADQQLRRFVVGPREPGALLDRGLWAWSRHPNYFGEMAFWWGLFVFGLAGSPGAWWTAVGALAITVMFRFVSLPMIEERMAARRKGWDDYVARTALVVPWPPRRQADPGPGA